MPIPEAIGRPVGDQSYAPPKILSPGQRSGYGNGRVRRLYRKRLILVRLLHDDANSRNKSEEIKTGARSLGTLTPTGEMCCPQQKKRGTTCGYGSGRVNPCRSIFQGFVLR